MTRPPKEKVTIAGRADAPGMASAFTGGLEMVMIPTSPLTSRVTGEWEPRVVMVSDASISDARCEV